MKPNTILLLQSALIFLQIVNAAIGNEIHLPPAASVVIAAFVGAFQFYINHLGNQLTPTGKGEENKK